MIIKYLILYMKVITVSIIFYILVNGGDNKITFFMLSFISGIVIGIIEGVNDYKARIKAEQENKKNVQD